MVGGISCENGAPTVGNEDDSVDLFAGPGGLNEGFSQFASPDVRFDVRLSIEKDPVACRTLRLRAFYREFRDKPVPLAFYEYIRGDSGKLKELQALPEWAIADNHVRQWTLGSAHGTAGFVSIQELHQKINRALSGAGGDWVLLGGPPCQAYSLIGRARMTGIGAKIRVADDPEETEKFRKQRESIFATDHRHTLYREYLRVVAVHQPAVFVMENVKGILSARVPISGGGVNEPLKYARVFEQIQKDLRDPWRALAEDPDIAALTALNLEFNRGAHSYKLFSFVKESKAALLGLEGPDFVIRAEKYGVPQTRHRVIVLGVRDDVSSAHLPLTPATSVVSVRQMIEEMPLLRSGISRDRDSVEKYGADSPVSWRAAVKGEIQKTLEAIQDPKLAKTIRQSLEDAEKLTCRESGQVPLRKLLLTMPNALRDFITDRELGSVIQHQSRSHMASDLARYLYLSASAAKTDAKDQQTPTLDMWPKALLPKHANVRYQDQKRVVDGFVDRFRVQSWDRPASTITSHIQKDGHYFIHPDPAQCRSLTVREAARLQTFPDNYYFEGNRTQQFGQIGNAVPPYLALQLARSVAAIFSAGR